MDSQCPCSNNIKVGIEVFPSVHPPHAPITVIPENLLRIMKKYKYNWRLTQLSKQVERKRTDKFIPPKVSFIKTAIRRMPTLDEEKLFYADQISRPLVRTLVVNRQQFGKLKGKKYVSKMNSHIQKAWVSIYNYYKYREMQRRLTQLEREISRRPVEKREVDLDRISNLSKPKKIYEPESLPKKTSQVFDDFLRLETMAAPKHFIILQPKKMGVSPAALEYEPTETILKLAQVPDRFKHQLKPLEPGKVAQSALRYKITDLVESLAKPKKRGDDTKEEDDVDPWTISKNALKYKATARILELAKPVERD